MNENLNNLKDLPEDSRLCPFGNVLEKEMHVIR